MVRVILALLLAGTLLSGCQKKLTLALDNDPIEPPTRTPPIEMGEAETDATDDASSEAPIVIQETPPPEASTSKVVDPLENPPASETQALEPRPAHPATQPASPQKHHAPASAPISEPIQPKASPVVIDKTSFNKTIAPKAPQSPEAPKPEPVGKMLKPITQPASLATPTLPSSGLPKSTSAPVVPKPAQAP